MCRQSTWMYFVILTTPNEKTKPLIKIKNDIVGPFVSIHVILLTFFGNLFYFLFLILSVSVWLSRWIGRQNNTLSESRKLDNFSHSFEPQVYVLSKCNLIWKPTLKHLTFKNWKPVKIINYFSKCGLQQELIEASRTKTSPRS
jgi:hypothetical protein